MSDPAVHVKMLEHTADLGIQIHAADCTELFASGPKVVYNLIGTISTQNNSEDKHRLTLKASDWENLFHDWLTEILYWFDVRQVIFQRCTFSILNENHLEVEIESAELDVEHSKISTELKAVTYHDLKIQHTADGLDATVIFDV